ncbi:hypothetical protein ACLOJK_041609 [Asimina triloba]
MKKKIVVKVQMACEKCRIKAKKIAASIEGVISIAVDGKDQEQLVVTGEGVDPVKLASKLRAKVASLIISHLQVLIRQLATPMNKAGFQLKSDTGHM